MRRALKSATVLTIVSSVLISVAYAQQTHAPLGGFKRIDMKAEHPRAYHPFIGDLYQFYLAYTPVPGELVENLHVTVDGRTVGVVSVADTSKGLPGAGEISLFVVARNLGLSHIDVAPVIAGKPATKPYRISFFVQQREPTPAADIPAAEAGTPLQFGFGDQPVDEEYYADHKLTAASIKAMPTFRADLADLKEFDARKKGWVSPAKNQGQCGSCWAFASVGTIESRILKDFGPEYDLSEQQQVSCNLDMSGCCGGSGRSLFFFCNNKPWLEQDAAYCEAMTQCPAEAHEAVRELSMHGTGLPCSGLLHGRTFD